MSKAAKNLENLDPSNEVMEINLGPQHPSTHGVLQLKLRLEGEIVVSAEPVIGFLHTGIEKQCESRTYHQVFTLIDRLDYLSGPSEEQVFAGAVERLMDVEVPERAQVIRVILLELSRISSHLIWVGTSALELNMSSVFMYCFIEREKILDLFEEMSGARMFPSVWRIGGLAHDISSGFEKKLKNFCRVFPPFGKSSTIFSQKTMSGGNGCTMSLLLMKNFANNSAVRDLFSAERVSPMISERSIPILDMKITSLMSLLEKKAIPMLAIWCVWKKCSKALP